MLEPSARVIAIVHDAPSIRSALGALLQAEGFSVVSAATAAEAFRIAAQQPDVLIIGTDLPDGDGFDACARLKTNPATRAIPVVLVSATYRGADDRSRALGACHADAYLLEPLDPTELRTTLDSLLRLRRAEAEARAGTAVLAFARSLSPALDPALVMQRVAESAAATVGATRCTVGIVEDEEIVIVASEFADGRADTERSAAIAAIRRSRVRDVPAVAEAMRSLHPVLIDDSRGHRGIPAAWSDALGARAMLIVPLVERGAPVGVLAFDRTDGPHAWSAEETDVAVAVAAQATLAVENAGLQRRARERAEQLRNLGAVTRAIGATTDTREVFHIVARAASRLLGAKITHVWIDDPVERVLNVRGSFGLEPELHQLTMEFFSIPYGHGVVGQVFARQAPEYIADIQHDSRWLNRRFATDAGLHAYAGLPLVAGSRIVGVLSVLFPTPRQFTDEDKDVMQLLAHHVAVAVRNAQTV